MQLEKKKVGQRSNQKSVYLEPDVAQAWGEFNAMYPNVRITDLINKTLRGYLPEAIKKGVDANLDLLIHSKK